MKKVLMIAYSFPPLGGGGVQRTLKFVKYLPNFGWQPYILTPKAPYHSAYDFSLIKEIPECAHIFRSKSWELAKVCNRISRQRAIWRFAPFLRRWFLFPDFAIGWLPFAISTGIALIRKEKIPIIYSTSAPYTDHLIGWCIKKMTGVKWVADFRDEWVTNPLAPPPETQFHEKLQIILERAVVSTADRVINVTEPNTQNFISRYCRLNPSKFITITNGFDSEDFSLSHPVVNRNEKFKIVYSGTLYGEQTAQFFLEALRMAIDELPELENNVEVIFVGRCNQAKELIGRLQLSLVVKFAGYVSHKKSIEYLMSANLLLLIVGETNGSSRVHPAKTFEYISSARPILALVPDGVVSNLIKISQSGWTVEPRNIKKIKQWIVDLYYRYKQRTLEVRPDRSVMEKFKRKYLTGKLAEEFGKIIRSL